MLTRSKALKLRRSERLRAKPRINYAESSDSELSQEGIDVEVDPSRKMLLEISIPFPTKYSDVGVIKKMRLTCTKEDLDVAGLLTKLRITATELPPEDPKQTLYQLLRAIADRDFGADLYDLTVAISKHLNNYPELVGDTFRPYILRLAEIIKKSFMEDYDKLLAERRVPYIAEALIHLMSL